MKKLTSCVREPKQNTSDQSKKSRLSTTGATSTSIQVSTQLKEVRRSKSYSTESTTNELPTTTKLKFVCISDTHCKLAKADAERIPHGDVLLHTGDFTMDGSVRELMHFNDFLGLLPHSYKVVIAGNHEDCLANDRLHYDKSLLRYYKTKYGVPHIRDLLTNCIYLEDELTEICGIKIYGSPWTQMYSSCDAFSLSSSGDELQTQWDKIPADVDILMTHGPPRGFGDTTIHSVKAGCRSLLHTVQTRVKPKFHVFGHIHEGYGIYKDGTTTFINASICTRGYKPTNRPVKFRMNIPKFACDREHTNVCEDLHNVCDTDGCNGSNCDMDCSKCDSHITGPNIPSAAFHKTPSELKSKLTECDNIINWNVTESDVTRLNYTKLTAGEMNFTSNEV